MVETDRHESIIALMEEAVVGEEAIDVIRRKAREIVSKHSKIWKGPPYCPFALADLEGVYVEEASCDILSDGRIFPKGDEVYIQYAQGQIEERVRFTIFHELAHTLFPDCYERVRRRSAAEKAEWEFENLCNTAASEFLFPFLSFTNDLEGKFPNAQRIDQLAARYLASVDATTRRLVHLSEEPSCVVFARYKEPVGKAVTSLSVLYSDPSSDFPLKIYRNVKINSKSVANIAHAEKRPVSGSQENWNIGGKWWRFNVEALPLTTVEGKDLPDVAIVLRIAG